jgi:hypothetical protein
MAWDKFVIYEPEKVIINENEKLDILELPSGKYFLNKKDFTTKEVLTILKTYTSDDLKNDFLYPIYTMVGHTVNGKEGITTRITNPKRLNNIIEEIEENLIKL